MSKLNVELNGTPQILTGGTLRRLEQELMRTWQRCMKLADELDAPLLMTGMLPIITAAQRNRELRRLVDRSDTPE